MIRPNTTYIVEELEAIEVEASETDKALKGILERIGV